MIITLNEISSDTIRSYLKKATDQRDFAREFADEHEAKTRTEPHKAGYHKGLAQAQEDEADKRQKGIDMAKKKLNEGADYFRNFLDNHHSAMSKKIGSKEYHKGMASAYDSLAKHHEAEGNESRAKAARSQAKKHLELSK